MKVVEIFDSIGGEGLRTGQTAAFIRLAGCNLRCSYCDTLYALFGEDEPCTYTEMTVNEVFDKVNKSFKRITLTGGEPLLHAESVQLCNMLADSGCEVNIETNGAVDIESFLEKISRKDKVFFTIDFKLPSSGMTDKMLWHNFEALRPCDVVKFVVGSDEDAQMMLDVTKKLNSIYNEKPHIYAGAVFGSYEPSKLVDLITGEPDLYDVVFQLQIHKVIWAPEMRGV